MITASMTSGEIRRVRNLDEASFRCEKLMSLNVK